MKREYIILGIGIFLLVFNVWLIANPDFSRLLGAATSNTAGAVVSVVANENNVTVPASGNVTFSDDNVNQRVNSISGLTESWVVNITLYGSSYPSAFTERAPNGTEVGPLRIEYFELNINQTNTNGSYTVFFNISQSELNISPANVSLFVFEDSDSKWNNLTTTVVNSTNNPRQFSAAATHFSKYLIGQSPPSGGGSGGGDSGGGDSGTPGGSGGGGARRATVAAPPPLTGDALVDLLLKRGVPLKPIRIIGSLFDVWIVIPEKYQELFPHETVVAEINLINLKKIGSTAVLVEYSIEDSNENQIFKSFETKIVENEVAYIKQITLPPDIDVGFYLFKVKVLYDDDVAIAGFPFSVIERPPVLRIPYSLWREAALLVITIIGIVFAVKYLTKMVKQKQMRRENKTERIIKRKSIPSDRHQDIFKQVQWLKEKYQRGLIPREMYKRRLLRAKKELQKK